MACVHRRLDFLGCVRSVFAASVGATALIVCTGVETGLGNTIDLVALFSANYLVDIVTGAMGGIEGQKKNRERVQQLCEKLDAALSERRMPQAPSLAVSPSGSIEVEQADFGWWVHDVHI